MSSTDGYRTTATSVDGARGRRGPRCQGWLRPPQTLAAADRHRRRWCSEQPAASLCSAVGAFGSQGPTTFSCGPAALVAKWGAGLSTRSHTITTPWRRRVSQFTAEVNSTSEPRETSSYLSLLRAGARGVRGSLREARPPDLVFAMRVSSSSNNSNSSSSYKSSSSKRQTTPVRRGGADMLQTAPRYTLRVGTRTQRTWWCGSSRRLSTEGRHVAAAHMGRPWLSGAEQKKANCISDGRAYNSRKRRYFLVFIGFARLANQIIIAVQT